MHFIFIIFLKHFIIWPYYITPNHNDVFHRYICKGFACHENDYPNHQITEFNDLINTKHILVGNKKALSSSSSLKFFRMLAIR